MDNYTILLGNMSKVKSNVISLFGHKEEKPEPTPIENHTTVDLGDDLDLLEDKQYLSDTEISHIRRLEKLGKENFKGSWRYQPACTIQSVKAIGDYLTQHGYGFETKLILGAGSKSTKHMVSFEIQTQHGKLCPVAGGEGNAKIMVTNSFNREGSYKISGGMYRFVCANGIVVGKFQQFSKIIHTQGQTFERKWRLMEHQIACTLRYIREEFGMKIEEMKAKELNYEQKMMIVLKTKQLNDTMVSELTRKLHPDNDYKLRVEDRDNNLWTLFNIINEVIREKSNFKKLDDGTTQGLSDAERNETLLDDIVKLAA